MEGLNRLFRVDFNRFLSLRSILLVKQYIEFLYLVSADEYPRAFIQPVITCSRLTIETLEQGVKYVQS